MRKLIAQRATINVLVDNKTICALLDKIVHSRDASMVQGRCGARFGCKTAKPVGVVSRVRWQNFKGNGAIQSSVKSAKDDPHPAAPQLLLHPVSAYYEIAQHRFSTRLLFLCTGFESELSTSQSLE